jgi:hypothetical protein
MSTPGKKRLRETADSELLPKRRKMTPTLQLLYDGVKEISQRLDAELLELLRIFPPNKSTAHGRNWITAIRRYLENIMTIDEIKREWAFLFDQDFGIIFPNEIIAQLTPGE